MALVSLSTLSTDIYLPFLPEMASCFHTTTSKTQLTLSVYMVGFAVSMLACGPLSDRFGRRPVVLTGVGLHLISTLLCVFSYTIEAFIIIRFFQALGGCCGTILARVIARDLFKEKECVKVLSSLSAGLAISLLIAPLIGGFLHSFAGWQASFVLLSMLSGMILLFSYTSLRETFPNTSRKRFYFRIFRQDLFTILKNRHFIGYTSVITFNWCGYFSFISASPFVFIKLLSISPKQYSIVFAVSILGYMGGTLLASRLFNRTSPEHSVRLGIFLTLLGSGSMMMLAFISSPTIFTIIFPMFFYLIGTGLIMPNAQAVVTMPFPKLTGCASSLFYFIEMLCGAIVGSLVGFYLKRSPFPMIISIFASSIFLATSFHQLIGKKRGIPDYKLTY